MRVRPKKMVWKFRWFIHNILIHSGPFSSAIKYMAIICKSCYNERIMIRTLLWLQASKQLFVPHTMQTTFWEIWVEKYAWLGVRWAPHLPRRPLTFAKGSDACKLGPKNHLYSQRKNVKRFGDSVEDCRFCAAGPWCPLLRSTQLTLFANAI